MFIHYGLGKKTTQASFCLLYSNILLHVIGNFVVGNEMLLTDKEGDSWLYFTSKGFKLQKILTPSINF